MFKKGILLTMSFVFSVSFSQEMVSTIPFKVKSNSDIFEIVNDSTKETILFIKNQRKVNAFRLNEKMQPIDTLSAENLDEKHFEIFGLHLEGSNPKLFWSDFYKNEIKTQLYDLKNHTVSNFAYSLDLKNEKFLQSFSENKKFYFITLVNNSNLLKLYVFNQDKLETINIDFSSSLFFDVDGNQISLSAIFEHNFFRTPEPFVLFPVKKYDIEKISTQSPSPLLQCGKKIKCYSNENEINITLDINLSNTQLITINLKRYTSNIKNFKKSFGAISDDEKRNSNSFLFEKKLFQLTLSSSKMILTITDIENGIIKQYNAFSYEPIGFKNSDIIRMNFNKKIIEKTSHFLKKINDRNCAVSCYRINGGTKVTIGSADEDSHAGSSGGMSPSGIPLAGGYSPLNISSFTYIYDKYTSYANRAAFYIDCFFDKEMNPVKEKLNPLAFDKIKDFSKGYYELPNASIYKLDDAYYLGFYHTKKKEYQLRKFKD